MLDNDYKKQTTLKMLKTFEDYRKENYLVNSYKVALNKNGACKLLAVHGAMRLREFLFECNKK